MCPRVPCQPVQPGMAKAPLALLNIAKNQLNSQRQAVQFGQR